jgi:hypothetical protein
MPRTRNTSRTSTRRPSRNKWVHTHKIDHAAAALQLDFPLLCTFFCLTTSWTREDAGGTDGTPSVGREHGTNLALVELFCCLFFFSIFFWFSLVSFFFFFFFFFWGYLVTWTDGFGKARSPPYRNNSSYLGMANLARPHYGGLRKPRRRNQPRLCKSDTGRAGLSLGS